MVFIVEGDGHLGPPEPHQGGEGLDSVHLLLGDAALPMGFICLGAPEDHEAALSLGELVVFLQGTACLVASLRGRLLGLALLAKGAMDVALHGCVVLEKMLRLPPMEQAGGLKRLLEVFRSCSSPVGLRSGDVVSHGDHLLPAEVSVLVLPVIALLGRGRIISAITTTKVAGGLGFPVEVGLDGLLTGGILGDNIQELPHRVRGLMAERVDERLAGGVVDEGVDHVGIGNVRELIALLGKALNVLLKGLVGPLLVVAEVPEVPQAGVGTLEVADENHMEITLAADAARLELLEPSSS
jgi:hypothetical protein